MTQNAAAPTMKLLKPDGKDRSQRLLLHKTELSKKKAHEALGKLSEAVKTELSKKKALEALGSRQKRFSATSRSRGRRQTLLLISWMEYRGRAAYLAMSMPVQ